MYCTYEELTPISERILLIFILMLYCTYEELTHLSSDIEFLIFCVVLYLWGIDTFVSTPYHPKSFFVVLYLWGIDTAALLLNAFATAKLYCTYEELTRFSCVYQFLNHTRCTVPIRKKSLLVFSWGCREGLCWDSFKKWEQYSCYQRRNPQNNAFIQEVEE